MKPAQAAAAPAADGSAPPNCAPMGSFSWSLLDNDGNLVDGTRPSSAAGATAAAAEGGSSSSGRALTGVPAAGTSGTVAAPTATSSPAPSAAKAVHDTRARSGTAESLAAASPAAAPAPATVAPLGGLAPLPTASDSTVAAVVGGDPSSSSSSAHPSLFSPPGPGTEALLPPAAAAAAGGGLPNSIINTIAPPLSAPIDDPLAGALWAAPQLAPESLISPQGRAGVQQQPRPAGNTGRAAQRRERRPSALARESDDGADLEGIIVIIMYCIIISLRKAGRLGLTGHH
jgi:hypothetical protein